MSGRVAASFYLPEAGLRESERSEVLLCREAEGVAARCFEIFHKAALIKKGL
jgi:hypothetical protein